MADPASTSLQPSTLSMIAGLTNWDDGVAISLPYELLGSSEMPSFADSAARAAGRVSTISLRFWYY